MPAPVPMLQRLVTRRSWSDRHGLGLIGWTTLSALFAVALVIFLMLFTDLVTVRGEAAREALQSGLAQRIVPETLPGDGGLLVQASRFGNTPGWGWLVSVCQAFPLLQSTPGALCVLVLLTFACVSGTVMSAAQARLQSARGARESATWLRSSIHRQTLRLGPSDLTGRRYQSALTHFVDDAEMVREALADWRWRFIRASIVIPVLAVVAIAIDWRLALECMAPVAACWVVYRYERQQGASRRRVAESHAETEVRFLAEALKQTRLVRGYNMEEFELGLFNRHLERLNTQSAAGRKLERSALSTARFVTWAGLTVILLLIALRVVSATAPLPLSAAVGLGVTLGMLFAELGSWERLLRARDDLEAAAERIYRYLDEIPEVGQAVGARFIQPVSKSIVLESVQYQHQGHEILKGVDLRIEAGSEVALVSTDPLLPAAIAYLLPRFIEPSRGRVLFDGEDIAWGTLESIRAETLFVGSDDPVLSGTVLDNILCGDTRHSPEAAMEAAKLVHLHKFITSLPQGYDTVLGENGETLDMGTAFRLGLARAVLRDPAVMIIAEPQVHLDEDNKNLLDDAYQRLSQKRTMIYLPGRLSTIRRCDQVVFLHEGLVEAIGSHSQLTKNSDLYRHWDYVTFNTFSRRSRRLQQA